MDGRDRKIENWPLKNVYIKGVHLGSNVDLDTLLKIDLFNIPSDRYCKNDAMFSKE
jgi:hypothetical protein